MRRGIKVPKKCDVLFKCPKQVSSQKVFTQTNAKKQLIFGKSSPGSISTTFYAHFFANMLSPKNYKAERN
jgi:hypothetical protein